LSSGEGQMRDVSSIELDRPLQCTSHVVRGPAGMLLIDPGSAYWHDELMTRIVQAGGSLETIEAVLLTHCHVDHAHGAYLFGKHGIDLVAGAYTADVLRRGARQMWYEYPNHIVATDVNVVPGDGQVFTAAGLTVRALHTPGHTPGCVSYLIDLDDGQAAFTGDLLNGGSHPGWAGSDGFSVEQSLASITRLSEASPAALYWGHGVLDEPPADWLDRAARLGRLGWSRRAKNRRLSMIRRLVTTLPDDQAAVWEDEADIDLNPRIGPDWMLPGQQRRVETPGQNVKRYLAGAMDATSGQLTYVRGERKDSGLFIKLLETLLKRYAGKRLIHVILDNYRIHSSRRVQAWLADQGRRIRLHFLPPYCPDDNRIERCVWRELHQNVTYNHACEDIDELLEEAARFLRRLDRRLRSQGLSPLRKAIWITNRQAGRAAQFDARQPQGAVEAQPAGPGMLSWFVCRSLLWRNRSKRALTCSADALAPTPTGAAMRCASAMATAVAPRPATRQAPRSNATVEPMMSPRWRPASA